MPYSTNYEQYIIIQAIARKPAVMGLFLCLSVVALVLAIHPFLTFPASLMLLPRRTLKVGSGPEPTIALLFCCHNEAASIGGKLDNLSRVAEQMEGLSIHIYLDDCSDETAAIIKSHPLKVRLVEGASRAGKNVGLNTLMRFVTADLVAFNDANVLLEVDALQRAAHYFADPEVGCAGSRLIYADVPSSPTAEAGGLYWRFEEWLKARESASGSCVAIDGSLFVIRRELFRELPADVPNDFFTSLDILTRGLRVVSAQDVVCYEKPATSSAEEFRRKIRISTRAMTCHLRLWSAISGLPFILQYIYYSHKVLRWFAFNLLVVATVSLGIYLVSAGQWVELLVGTAGMMALVALLFVAKPKLAAQVMSLLAALMATAIGASRALAGVRTSVWTIPRTSRL